MWYVDKTENEHREPHPQDKCNSLLTGQLNNTQANERVIVRESREVTYWPENAKIRVRPDQSATRSESLLGVGNQLQSFLMVYEGNKKRISFTQYLIMNEWEFCDTIYTRLFFLDRKLWIESMMTWSRMQIIIVTIYWIKVSHLVEDINWNLAVCFSFWLCWQDAMIRIWDLKYSQQEYTFTIQTMIFFSIPQNTKTKTNKFTNHWKILVINPLVVMGEEGEFKYFTQIGDLVYYICVCMISS